MGSCRCGQDRIVIVIDIDTSVVSRNDDTRKLWLYPVLTLTTGSMLGRDAWEPIYQQRCRERRRRSSCGHGPRKLATPAAAAGVAHRSWSAS